MKTFIRNFAVISLLLLSIFSIACHSKSPLSSVESESTKSSIFYVLNGGNLPDNAPKEYAPGTELTLPTPTREGYIFSGWFTSSDLRVENSIIAIPNNVTGDQTVYAKWNKIISVLDGSMLGDGDDNAKNRYAITRTTNGSKETTDLKNAFSTVDRKLLWKQGNSRSSNLICHGDLVEALGGERELTFSLTVSIPDEKNSPTTVFRLKIGGYSIPLFKTSKSGEVTLGQEEAAHVLNLGNEITTFSIVVSFDDSRIYAYDNKGVLIISSPLIVAEGNDLTTDEFYSLMTNYSWQWYSQAQGAAATDHRYIYVHNISVFGGNSAVKIDKESYNKAERDALLAEIKPLYEAQREQIASGALLGVATENIGVPLWEAAPTTPSDEHPRLLITSDDLPLIREMLEENNKTNKRFRALLESELESGGRLGEPLPDFDDRDGLHNYDKSVLELIQVKALGYLLEGHELFGYQAIYYMKNFLLTLDIQYIASDQCHEYGNTMFTAALVYDWCYDLLTEDDKAQLIAGVETRTASGYCGDPSYTSNPVYKLKMEVGFPPSGQSAVSGHGAGAQVLRNYLAAAIAFYGDNDSWWDYVAARVYSEYVPVRNYYYTSGITSQGTAVYAAHRISYDHISAWLLTAATGDNPYVGMENTVRGMMGYECAAGILFTEGDGTYETRKQSTFLHSAYMAAYLYKDGEMLAFAEDLLGQGGFGAETKHLTSALYVALRGTARVERAENKYESMDLIQYNGHPVGQYIVHEAWNSNESAAVFMKIKEMNTANHEHDDAGVFEIYYKGMLTSDGGCYNVYGKPQTKYFHKATISHNGLIIFNPSKWDYSSSDLSKKWYSGSQISPGAINSFDEFLTLEYCKTGTVTGRQHGYFDGDIARPEYAYIAGDITAAYTKDTVSYVGRRMLTVYTGDESFPMVFFVYDDITALSASYEKRFLLQISSMEEPTVNEAEKTIITENGDGRLVLTCLSDGVSFNKVGGRNNGTYSAKLSMNYAINGHQCLPESDSADDKHWGRVEITAPTTSKESTFMNLLYVTDRGQTKAAPTIDRIMGEGVQGGVFGEIAAVFATSRDREEDTLSFTTTGSDVMRYYVCGLAEGEWSISIDGKFYDVCAASADGGMLTFTAPAGSVVITHKR